MQSLSLLSYMEFEYFEKKHGQQKFEGLRDRFVIVICLSGLIQRAIASSGDQLERYQQGGVVGQWLAAFLSAYLAEVGSIIVLLAMLIVSLLLIRPNLSFPTGATAAFVWPFVKSIGQYLSALSFRGRETLTHVKPNKSVKINRALATRGGVATLPYATNAHKQEDPLLSLEAEETTTTLASAASAIERVLIHNRRISKSFSNLSTSRSHTTLGPSSGFCHTTNGSYFRNSVKNINGSTSKFWNWRKGH